MREGVKIGLIDYFTRSNEEKTAEDCCRIARENIKEAEKLRKREFEKRIAAKDFHIGDVVTLEDITMCVDDVMYEHYFKHCDCCKIKYMGKLGDIPVALIEGVYCLSPWLGSDEPRMIHVFCVPIDLLSASWRFNKQGC